MNNISLSDNRCIEHCASGVRWKFWSGKCRRESTHSSASTLKCKSKRFEVFSTLNHPPVCVAWASERERETRHRLLRSVKRRKLLSFDHHRVCGKLELKYKGNLAAVTSSARQKKRQKILQHWPPPGSNSRRVLSFRPPSTKCSTHSSSLAPPPHFFGCILVASRLLTHISQPILARVHGHLIAEEGKEKRNERCSRAHCEWKYAKRADYDQLTIRSDTRLILARRTTRRTWIRMFHSTSTINS